MGIIRKAIDKVQGKKIRGIWRQIYAGRFPLRNPDPSDINIENVALALSKICRYTGQTGWFYSVAQHSVLVSKLCRPENALWGLLHDAPEAYIGDIITPIKKRFPGIRKFEWSIMKAILRKYDLPFREPVDVKWADNVLLVQEMNVFFGVDANEDWGMNVLLPNKLPLIEQISIEEARVQFLERFRELTQ